MTKNYEDLKSWNKKCSKCSPSAHKCPKHLECKLEHNIADESVLEHIAQRYNVALPLVFDDSIKDQLHQNTVGVWKLNLWS